MTAWAPLLVFLGGGLGAVARWSVSLWVPGAVGTLIVNVLGSALLAGLAHPHGGLDLAAHPWRLALMTGALGGFTTYSTFNLDVLSLLQAGQPGRAALLAGGTLGACLGAGALGWAVAGGLADPPTLQ